MLSVRDLIPWSRGRDVTTGRGAAEHPLVAFQREIDRLFDDLWRGFELPVFGRLEQTRGGVTPRIDVAEDEREIAVSAELPGMDEKGVEVIFTESALTIKGEKRAERERGYACMERYYGAFQRTISFDAEVETDKVEAAFKNGVLTVILPKTPEAQKKFKKIPINVSGEGERSEQKAA